MWTPQGSCASPPRIMWTPIENRWCRGCLHKPVEDIPSISRDRSGPDCSHENCDRLQWSGSNKQQKQCICSSLPSSLFREIFPSARFWSRLTILLTILMTCMHWLSFLSCPCTLGRQKTFCCRKSLEEEIVFIDMHKNTELWTMSSNHKVRAFLHRYVSSAFNTESTFCSPIRIVVLLHKKQTVYWLMWVKLCQAGINIIKLHENIFIIII